MEYLNIKFDKIPKMEYLNIKFGKIPKNGISKYKNW